MEKLNRSISLKGKLPKSKASHLAEPLEGRLMLSTTWYVAKTGSNFNPGSLAAPFLTIQAAANKAQAGDTVLIETGVYHETVTVPHSGNSAAKITFQNYNNESVTIDGADAISGWTNIGGSIYSAPMSTNLGEGNNQVFVDGQMMNEARWPNTPLILTPGAGFDLTHPALETMGSVTNVTTTTATINDPNLTQGPGFWNGAIIRLGAGQNWYGQTGTVTSSGVGFINISYSEQNLRWQIPTAGNPYYLYGTPNALDSAGEWIRTNGQLRLWTPAGDSPANHTVEVKTRQYGFNVSNASYIRIQGLNLFACSILTNTNSAHVVIDAITDQFVSQFGISSSGITTPVQTGIILAGYADCLEYSVIAGSAGNGVNVSGSGCVLLGNVIHDTDYTATDTAAIRVAGSGNVVTQNTLYDTGRDGILFQAVASTVSYNNIYNFGIQTTDMGGFYTRIVNGAGSIIEYNTIHGSSSAGFASTGIRFDGPANNFVVYRNITYNVNDGIELEGDAHGMKLYNNTFDCTTGYSLACANFAWDWSGTIMENNIFTHKIEFGLNFTLTDNISNHQQFVNMAAGDFDLIPGAPAIDTGLVIPGYTNGYLGAAPDVGALEYGVPAFSTGAIFSLIPADPTTWGK